MSKPRFTVVCPAYNRSAAIGETLESVLRQSDGDFDLLVGSDGSTDDTDDVVAEFARADRRVKLLRLEHTGDPGLVRGQLCRRSSADYVAYIDHDDLWREDHLAVLGAALDAGSALVASGARYQREDGRTTVLGGRSLLWHPEIAVLDPYAEPSRVAHRRALLEQAGGWHRAGRGLEDWDLWWRMASRGTALQPVDELSAVVSINGSTRRHSLDYKMVSPLAGTGDIAAATSVLKEWPDSIIAEGFAGDFCRWAAAIDDDPSTVLPLSRRGHMLDAAPPAGALTGTVEESLGVPGAALALGMFPGGRDGWLVGLAAPIVSSRHGRCIDSVLSRRFPAAIAHVQAALARRLQEVHA